jgi:antitoxin ParD1/3/4
MNVSLTPELEEMVNRKVKSGLYNSASEVIREGLRRLQEEDELKNLRREELRREILKGMEQMRNGQYKSYSSADELIEDVIKEAREEFAAREKNFEKV